MRKARDTKLGGAAFIPVGAKLNVTTQSAINMPHMVLPSGERVHNYRKPIMKEKSSVENLIVTESHDKRARARENFEVKRRAN